MKYMTGKRSLCTYNRFNPNHSRAPPPKTLTPRPHLSWRTSTWSLRPRWKSLGTQTVTYTRANFSTGKDQATARWRLQTVTSISECGKWIKCVIRKANMSSKMGMNTRAHSRLVQRSWVISMARLMDKVGLTLRILEPFRELFTIPLLKAPENSRL